MDSRRELEDLEYRYYNEMKDGTRKVKISESLFRCPFCYIDRKRDYRFEELLRHASVNSGSSQDLREKAGHVALKRYMSKYLHAPDEDSSSFVYPWKGILANIKGAFSERSGRKIKEELVIKGFNPHKVIPLWNRFGHTGFAIVDFGKDWVGFRMALMFENHFEVNHCGRRDYYAAASDGDRGDKLYGWLAKKDDYYSRSVIGDHLRKKGDLKTVSGKEAEEKRKASALISNLENTLETKNNTLQEMEMKYNETSTELEERMREKDEMITQHNEKMSKLQKKASEYLDSINETHEKASQKLEKQREEYEMREKYLDNCRAQNKAEREKLQLEKQKNLIATQEQNQVNEDMTRLAEQQQTERKELRKRVLELQQKLEDEQKLELEIERMRGYLQVKGHMQEGEEDPEIKKTEEELKEKEEEWDYQESIYQALVVKHGYTNDELQDARKALINSMQVLKVSGEQNIGVKRMGALDEKPFLKAAKEKYPAEEADVKAVELCSLWDEYLRDSGWHPFKIIAKEGTHVEVLIEEDEKLQGLKKEMGEEVFEAVTQSLRERNEYNGSGRYVVPELWNFEQGRKASLKEGVVYLLNLWQEEKKKPEPMAKPNPMPKRRRR